MHQGQRVGIFVDVQNIYHSAKNLYKSRVNFEQLMKALIRDRSLVRAFAYVVKSEHLVHAEEEMSGEGLFFEALKKAGLELRLKDLQIYPDGLKKADWDVGLAVDAIRMASSLDTIILVTGDGDFVPLVEYLIVGLGKHVEVAAFSKTTSGKLKDATNKFIELEKIPKILMRIKKSQKKKK